MKPATFAELDEIFFTTNELAARWRQEVATLENQRVAGTGMPFVKLPSGAIRYRASDVIDAELNGLRGLTLDRVCKTIKDCPLLHDKLGHQVAKFVRGQLTKKRG